MLKQFMSASLTASLIALISFVPLNAQTLTTKELQKAEKIKSKVAGLGSGPKVRVIVGLLGDETIKGYVSSIGEESFVVERSESVGPREIFYAQVKEVRKKPSTGFLVAEVGAAAGTVVGLFYLSGFLLSKCSPCIGP